MSTFKGRGIIIKEVNTGESNKFLTILFKEHGKMTVFSKGARNTKSKFLAGTQLFAYSDFVIFNKIGLQTTTQVDLIESFYKIRNDYNKLCYGSYFLELTNHFLFEGINADNILYLLIRTFSTMEKNIIDDKIIYLAFSFKFLQLNGYFPFVYSCSNCNKPLDKNIYFYYEGALCQNCKSKSIMNISETSIYTINHILNSDIKNLYSFTITDKIYIELKKALKIFMDYHFDVNTKSLDFLI